MKKVALAALLSSVVSGSALADATANMVFEGTVTSTVPGTTLKITGIGGGLLTNGKLTVKQDGTFTTERPVDFEIRNVADDAIATGKNLKYTSVNVVANGTSVIGALPTLRLGSGASTDKLTEGTNVTITDGTDALHIESAQTIAGFSGGDVSATVAVMVSEPSPAAS